jgi:chromosome segregation ATPase
LRIEVGASHGFNLFS